MGGDGRPEGIKVFHVKRRCRCEARGVGAASPRPSRSREASPRRPGIALRQARSRASAKWVLPMPVPVPDTTRSRPAVIRAPRTRPAPRRRRRARCPRPGARRSRRSEAGPFPSDRRGSNRANVNPLDLQCFAMRRTAADGFADHPWHDMAVAKGPNAERSADPRGAAGRRQALARADGLGPAAGCPQGRAGDRRAQAGREDEATAPDSRAR